VSTGTFVNALIGLAREFKTEERRHATYVKRVRRAPCLRHSDCVLWEEHVGKCSTVPRIVPPAFGHAVAVMLVVDGYFPQAEAAVFGDALQGLLESSDPRRKKK
jgi:hypothetical protein